MVQKWWVLSWPGKYITCLHFSGDGDEGSVLEFFREAILGIITGNVPVRMLLLSTGENKTKAKQNTQNIASKGDAERSFSERRCQEPPLSRKTTVLLKKPIVETQTC